jgi:hypothetical protein
MHKRKTERWEGKKFISPHPRRPGLVREIGLLEPPPGWEPVTGAQLPLLRHPGLGVSALGMTGPEEDGNPWTTISLCRDPPELPFELAPLFDAACAFVPEGTDVRFRTATNERGVHRIEVQWSTARGASSDCELTEVSVKRFLLLAAVASIPTIVRRPDGFLRVPAAPPPPGLVDMEAPRGWERIETPLGHGYHRAETTTAVLLEEEPRRGEPWRVLRVFHYEGIPIADVASAGAAFLGPRRVRVATEHHAFVLACPLRGWDPGAHCALREDELGRWVRERASTLLRAIDRLDASPVSTRGKA